MDESGPADIGLVALAARLGLTRREAEVVELVRIGLTNDEIARHLYISPGTVRKHLEHAYLKLGVHTRTQAAAAIANARVLPPMPPTPGRPRDLPRYLTAFVGRQHEIDRLRSLIGNARLLTLTGPGGVGKTRLVVTLVEGLTETRDTTTFVELGSLSDPALVPQAVASAVGLREVAGYSIVDGLIQHLGPRRALLILDNCEHLVDACATLVEMLLWSCPNLIAVITSRQALGVDGEVVYPVPPLSVPGRDDLPAVDRLADWEAVELFRVRAASTRADFALTAGNARSVVEICRRLDGIPLAIELAAALVRTRPLELIAGGLQDRFRTLTGGSRTAVARHQTLAATVSWSYQLLTDAERTMLNRLSVFRGSFNASAAQRVTGSLGGPVTGDDPSRTLALLGSLVDQSLVVFDSSGSSGRYRLLETVRDYGLERLSESGEIDRARREHRDWCLALVERAREPLFGGPLQAAWLARLDVEHDNLRAALEWSQEDPEGPDALLRLAAGLWRFWEIEGYLAEGRMWLELALAGGDDDDSELRANALTGAAVLAHVQGDFAASMAHHEASLAMHRARGDLASVSYGLSNIGSVALQVGDHARAKAAQEEASALMRQFGRPLESAITDVHVAEIMELQGLVAEATRGFEDTIDRIKTLASGEAASVDPAFAQWVLGYGLGLYASIVLKRGEPQHARELALDALFIYRRLGNGREVARMLALLADIADARADPLAAVSLLVEALAARYEMGDRSGLVATIERLSVVAVGLDPIRSARLLGVADALRVRIGTPLSQRDRAAHGSLREALIAKLGEERVRGEIEIGRRTPVADAVADAAGIAGGSS